MQIDLCGDQHMHLIHGRLPIRELDACQPGSRNDRLRKGRVQNCRTRKVVLQYAEMMYVSAYCCGAFDLVGSYKQLEQ